MSTYDVHELGAGFWELGNYRHNVKRIKEGTEQLDDFSKMCKERAEIEGKYARTLQVFHERWSAHFEKSMMDNSVRTALLHTINESEAVSIQHSRLRERLLDEIVTTLALFRKENHHPSAFRAPKEIREIEEGFEKAQRQWKKLHEKAESARKAYYNACRQARSAGVLLANANSDTSVSPDNAAKLKERHEKAQDESNKLRIAYEGHIKEMTTYKAPYMENMSFVFAKCQEMELKRQKFFIEMIRGVQQVLVDLARSQKCDQMHATLESTIRQTDEGTLRADLQRWSQIYGVDAPSNWPSFEEYRPEMRQIGSRKDSAKDNGGVVLTRQIIRSEEAVVPPSGSSNASENGKSSDSDTNTFDSHKIGHRGKAQFQSVSSVGSASKPWEPTHSPPSVRTPDSEKFSAFDDDASTTQRSTFATVLYDYSPIEGDEIALTKGETIEVLSAPDSLGWCTGRKNGLTGLFPASYAKVV